MTNDADRLSIVRGETDVDLRTPEGNWMDKFIAFLSGDEPVKGAFTNMGFSEEIIVGKREVHDTETVSEGVRREEAAIDRTDNVLEAEEETNRFERNELNDNPLNNRNRL